MNNRKCYVNGKMGLIIKDDTYTVDVLLFKSKKTLSGVSKECVKMAPLKPSPKKNPKQLKLNLYN